ncbi:hypothetical protein CDL12_26879 [Handroanthus impetiginosus]|uniref:Retrotransposon Copia-like N-terminal domain-containing protein n=1 Tax=Handroanthus impetiginosus TaxID=429701 RepID=A0A2G9G5N2_9LAMI|nr:hypothetical protein CDL12_26879 [Handroanthus impetiginosus]
MTKNLLFVILEVNKLTSLNYSNWFRNLKIVLDSDKRTYVLTQSPPDILLDDAKEDMREIVNCWREDDVQTRCLILASMSSEFQKSHKNMKHASEIYMHLEELYSAQTRYEHYNTSKELFRARMVEKSSVHEHNLILQSLPISFEQFVMNFNMSKLDVTVNELVNMLVTVESTIKKNKTVLVTSTSKAHKGGTGKKKKKSSSKGK